MFARLSVLVVWTLESLPVEQGQCWNHRVLMEMFVRFSNKLTAVEGISDAVLLQPPIQFDDRITLRNTRTERTALVLSF